MHAFLVSISVVFLAEIGDKTQLLAFVLAAKFRKPLPIILGILIATIFNHLMASALGLWLGNLIHPQMLRWILGISFLAMAVWTLIPDKFDESDTKLAAWGVFGTTLITFFLAEMGDKTQIATVALAAQYHTIWLVAAGTVIGMLLADVPAVFIGERLANKANFAWIRYVASALFAILGVLALIPQA